MVLWLETDLVDGIVQRRVVVTLDATMNTATVLTRSEAVQVANRRCWRLPSDPLSALGTAPAGLQRAPAAVSEGDHPPGVLKARCGHLLPTTAAVHDRPRRAPLPTL